MYKSDCIFCKIAKKEIPAKIIFENDDVIAVNDINPQAPTHILVIPKNHFDTLNDLEDESLMGKLISAIKQIAKQENIKEYRTVLNTGKQAGQEVFHIHFHMLSGRTMLWPPG